MKSINPATEELIREYPEDAPQRVEQLLNQAQAAFPAWRRRSFEERAGFLHGAARVLRGSRRRYAELMTAEMGKPIAAAEAEIEKCALTCDYFAEHAALMLDNELIPSDATRSYVRYDPLGVILAVMPWNFPFWQLFRFAAPALMAGNVALLKHASNVCGCALAIEEVFRQAGFPPGVFTTLLISSQRVQPLIAHPLIRAVTLTGSEGAGRAIGAAAGKAMKKSVLELGGADPFIVLPDVDLESTAEAAASARCINTGQSCIAAKRFIVDESIADDFEEALTARMAARRVGDPMDRSSDLGPLARGDLRQALHDQVQRSLAAGAHLRTGGRPLEGRGYYYAPTVLSNVRPGIPAFDEETFGPVAAVIRAKGVEDAIALANHSTFGLGASIWSNDLAVAERMAAALEAGCVFINGPVKSDPRLPFGGVKHSGYGRELAEVGIREFVNIKTVWVKRTEALGNELRSE